MPAVKWFPAALKDVERLFDFLADKNLGAALRARDCIRGAAQQLKNYPQSGYPRDNDGGRELYIPHGAGTYVVRYRIDHFGDVIIVRVWHSREKRGPG